MDKERSTEKTKKTKQRKRRLNKIWKFVDENTSTFIVILSFILCAAYTITAIVVQSKTFTELSPTLTENVFKFFGFELISLATIKVSKNIKEAVIKKGIDELSELSDNLPDENTGDADLSSEEDAVG